MEIYEFSKPMIISATALRKRWPGLTPREFAQAIDDSNDSTNPAVMNDPYARIDFPKCFKELETWHEGDVKIYKCQSCESDFENKKPYIRPYRREKKGSKFKYNWGEIFFKKSDVVKYEEEHPEVLGDVEPDEANSETESQKVRITFPPALRPSKGPETITVPVENVKFWRPERSGEDKGASPKGHNSGVELPELEIIIPKSLWLGKSHEAIVKAMVDEEYAASVIAYVLNAWCRLTNMVKLGRLLKKEDLTDSAYGKYARKLLKEAEGHRIVRGQN